MVSQRHSSTKEMLDVGSAPPTLISFSLILFSLIVPKCLVYPSGDPNSERSHTSTTLTPGRSSLKRAFVASGMLSLRMVSSHLLPLTSKPIVPTLSSNSTKLSWTLSGESLRVASSKYHTLNSDWTPRAASSTDRAKRAGQIWSPCWMAISEANPSLPKNNLVGDEYACYKRL